MIYFAKLSDKDHKLKSFRLHRKSFRIFIDNRVIFKSDDSKLVILKNMIQTKHINITIIFLSGLWVA